MLIESSSGPQLLQHGKCPRSVCRPLALVLDGVCHDKMSSLVSSMAQFSPESWCMRMLSLPLEDMICSQYCVPGTGLQVQHIGYLDYLLLKHCMAYQQAQSAL